MTKSDFQHSLTLFILGICRDNLGPRRSLASNKRQSSLEDPASGKCLSEDGAAVVRRMSGDASEKSDITSESMPPNAANTPGKSQFSNYIRSERLTLIKMSKWLYNVFILRQWSRIFVMFLRHK